MSTLKSFKLVSKTSDTFFKGLPDHCLALSKIMLPLAIMMAKMMKIENQVWWLHPIILCIRGS